MISFASLTALIDGPLSLQEKSYLQKCLVCWEKSDLLAIASCMHPVCLKCTIRMRVLGNSKECPVCRSNMEMVGGI